MDVKLNMFFRLIPAALTVGGIFLVVAVIYGWKWRVDREERRSPFTSDLLRGPGHSTREKAEELFYDAFAYMMLAGYTPLVFYAAHLQSIVIRGRAPSRISGWIMVISAALVFAVLLARALRLLDRRRSYRLGAQGEQAVGEELNRLVAKGCHVFHDVPADDFNIDHVVVGPAGVFAVETKARRKPTRGKGKEDATVIFDGERLVFPDWKESRCLKQARNQARWLSEWLASPTGERVPVMPVLALPGWLVERRAPPKGLHVMNSREEGLASLFTKGDRPISEATVERIVDRLDQRCRNIVVKQKPRRR